MGKGGVKGRGAQVTINIPRAILSQLDELISKGYFRNRSDAIREAVRLLILKYRSLESQKPIPA